MKTIDMLMDSVLTVREQDLRIDLVDDLVDDLKKEFTRPNPKFYKQQAMGFWVWNIPKEIKSWKLENGLLEFPRGALDRVSEIAAKYGITFSIDDATVRHSKQKFVLQQRTRPYQEEVIDSLEASGWNATFRGPCGSGKTILMLAAIARLGQPALVIVHTQALMNQWLERVAEWLNFTPGRIGGGKKERIRPITIGLQQSIWRMDKKSPGWIRDFGVIIGDECHIWGSKTFQIVGRMFPAAYRIGCSADERRKDGLDFLIHETFGPMVHEITQDELQQLGNLVPVRMEVVETDYADEDFQESREVEETPDWVGMITRLTKDENRNKLIFDSIRRVLGENPNNRILLLSERVDACKEWKKLLVGYGIEAGMMIGGVENRHELDGTKFGLITGKVRVGVGTKVADEGLDIPPLTHVFLTCPLHQHPKRLTQMVGRSARPYPGKDHATAVYFWDRNLFPFGNTEDLNNVILGCVKRKLMVPGIIDVTFRKAS